MRILFVTDDAFSPSGIRSYLQHLSRGLQEKGFETRTYSPPPPRHSLDGLFSGGLSVRHFFGIRSLMQEWRPDVLHAHSVSMRVSPSPLIAARRMCIPVVMTVHDFNYVCPRKWLVRPDGSPCADGFGPACLVSNCGSGKSGWKYLLYQDLRWLKIATHRALLKHLVDIFICPSDALRQRLTESLKTGRTRWIPNFIAEGPREDTAYRLDSKELLYVGRLSPEKGVDRLIRSMPLILSAHPDASLAIVGDGPCRRNLESISDALGIGARMSFLGEVPNEELDRYYRRCAAVILPSLWMENCPVTAIEALSWGRPLIGSDFGGISELISDGTTGLLFERGSIEGMAKSATIFLSDERMRSRMSAEALHTYKDLYSKETHLARLMGVYTETVREIDA